MEILLVLQITKWKRFDSVGKSIVYDYVDFNGRETLRHKRHDLPRS